MSVHLEAHMTRRAILERVIAAERDAADLLDEAARVVEDPAERRLYLRLRDAETRVVEELQREEARLDAEEFVERAIDV